MKKIATQLTVLTLSVFVAAAAVAQQQSTSSDDLSCRNKAKDVAAQAYNSCMNDSHSAQIDQIRKEYQRQLAELKSRYDADLKQMGAQDLNKPRSKAENSKPLTSKAVTSSDITAATRSSMKAKPAKRSASNGSRPKATKGIAKSLPTRKETVAAPAPVVQQATEETTVVTPEQPLPSSDDEAAQNEMQLTLVPASTASEL